VNLAEMMKSDKFERAKNEVRMLHDEIKPTDVEYIKEEEEISFEKKVKERSIREYLEYLTLKIVLALSKK
jgi:hypothetical protein